MSIKLGEKDLFPYLGDCRPVNIYKGEHKVAGWKWESQSGEELHFENTYNDFVEVEIDGKSYQEGEPSPDAPVEIHSLNDFDVVSSTEKLSEGQLEEYNYNVEYENIHKINLLLDEPLRSVGDVKDRLFRDSDGLWKVERNIGYEEYDGTENIRIGGHESGDPTLSWAILPLSEPTRFNFKERQITTHINTLDNPYAGTKEWVYFGLEKDLRLRFRKGMTLEEIRSWLSTEKEKGTPFSYEYQLKESTIETIPRELQDKLNNLRSFEDSNYVYTVAESLKPTLLVILKVKDM